jgi:hypothetical protein
MRLLVLTCLARVLAIVHGACSLVVDPAGAADLTPAVTGMTPALRVEAVTGTPGCVAFWDFVKREPGEPQRLSSWRGWGRSFHWSARTAAATSD